MYAVIRTGSKQYRVEPGSELLVEKLDGAESGKPITLSDVLFYAEGADISVGKPVLSVTVHCTCLGNEKGDKLRTHKYTRRANYHRTYGHRQAYTRLRVDRFERKGN